MDFDFSIFYKKKYPSLTDFVGDSTYDLFISAYNDSTRVKDIFDGAVASEKHWLIFKEYKYASEELPKTGTVFTFANDLETEGQIIRNYFSRIDSIAGKRICVDITGFIRPHLIFLVRFLHQSGIDAIDFIYTDPITYKEKEHTEFSLDYIDVRQVEGFLGNHDSDVSNDFLIIGSGYDNQRITDISRKKANAKKVQLFGFPSLQPDMFQENILKAYKAEEASSSGRKSFIHPDFSLFAPANDPFVTANVIQEFVERKNKLERITNLYLSPLSTKAQTLGFALYYISRWQSGPGSIIFPFCDRYSRETTEGIAKIWKYSVNLQELKSVSA